MAAFGIKTMMLAFILFSIYLAPLKAIGMQQPLPPIVKGPMTFLPPAPQLLPVFSPIIPPAYFAEIDQTGFQVPLESQNCQNSEVLQNILILLNSVLSDESILHIKEPNEVQLKILALLKKYIQFMGSQNIGNIEVPFEKAAFESNDIPLFELQNDENPRNHIKAEFNFKYHIPNSSCADTINVLIQTLYNAYSRLNFLCRRTGKCNLQSQFQELPSILKDLSRSPTSNGLYSNNIYDIPQIHDPQNQIPYLKAKPEINFLFNHGLSPNNLNFELNKIPSNGKKNIYQDIINDYTMLLAEVKKLKEAEKKDSIQNEFLTEQLYAKLFNNKESLGSSYVPLPAKNYVPNKILSFDEFLKGLQNHYSKLTEERPPAIANNNKQINLNYHVPPASKQHQLGLLELKNKLFTYPENRLQPNIYRNQINLDNFPKVPIPNSIGLSQMEIIKTPQIHEMILKPLDINRQEIQIINPDSNLIHKIHPFQRVNPYAPGYFPNYFQQDVYGSNLLDSLHSASVNNLVKLNLAPDNNGIVELTYMLPKPVPFHNKRYYYVKYRLPYRALILKLSELSKNTNLKISPLRLNEALLSASNLADVSPDLKDIGNEELTKLITKEGNLVDAKVLPVNHPKTEIYLKTIQKLNDKLNTNEILNLVQNDAKTTRNKNVIEPSSESQKLNEELSSKIYHDPSLSPNSNPYFANNNRNSLSNSLPNAVAMNSLNPMAALPSNNLNSRVKQIQRGFHNDLHRIN